MVSRSVKKQVGTLLYVPFGLFFLLAIGFCSCNTNDTQSRNTHQTQTKPIGSLTGHLYHIGPELDSAACKATGGCDCCASDLLFLTDSHFMAVDYCLENDVYYKGTYKINASTISFYCDSLIVDKEYNAEKWEADTIDQNAPDFFVKARRDKVFDFQWTGFYFKNRLCFRTSFGDYSTPDNEGKNHFISDTKRDSIWFKLELE